MTQEQIMQLVHAFADSVSDYVASDYVSASHTANLQARAEDAKAAVVAALETLKGSYNPINDINYYTEAQFKQALRDVLEQAAQEATDAVAFNGGTVQMEAHVREAIRKMIGEIK